MSKTYEYKNIYKSTDSRIGINDPDRQEVLCKANATVKCVHIPEETKLNNPLVKNMPKYHIKHSISNKNKHENISYPEREFKKGLSPAEVKELIEYIQKNNSWENMYECIKNNRKVIKYYDMSFDTRTGDMWMITFRVTGKDPVEFKAESDTFKKDIYSYLDEKEN